jgi:1-phosphofructokinase
MNPAIDYVMSIPELSRGAVNRSDAQRYMIAGKGINVSLALKEKGIASTAVCLCGEGFVSEQFRTLLEAHGLEHVTIPVTGCDLRINVKVCHDDLITEVNGSCCVDENTAEAVAAQLDELLGIGDILIIGGSLPDGMPQDFYAGITRRLTAKNVLVIADTSGDSLRELVKGSEPFLIKPNRQEFGELFCVDIESVEDAIAYGRKTGCNALISMGEHGAVLVTSDEVYVCHAPRVVRGYTVGAGDALLAGFVADYIRSKDYEQALIAGVDAATDYIVG